MGLQPAPSVRAYHGFAHPLCCRQTSNQGECAGACPRDRASEGAGCECCLLRVEEARQKPGASRLGNAVIDGSSEQGIVTARECRHDSGHLRSLMKCDLPGNQLRQDRPSFGRAKPLVRMHHYDPKFVQHGQLDQVQRIDGTDQHDPTKQRRGDVVQMPAGDCSLCCKAGGKQTVPVHRASQQRVHGNCRRNGRSRAPPLASGEWQSLADRQCDAGRAGAVGPHHVEQGRGSEAGRVALGFPRQVGMSGIENDHSGPIRPLGANGVTLARQSQTQNVQAGPDIADPAGCKGGDALLAAHACKSYLPPMLGLLKLIQSIIKTLHSAGTPGQVAAGMALGSALGLTPLMNLHNLVIFSILVLLNVSFGGGMLGWMLFVPVGFLLDPLFDAIGLRLLTAPSLRPLWTDWTNTPILPFTNFNNSVVLGSFVSWVVLAVPIFFAARYGVARYRATLGERVRQSRFYKAITASQVYNVYKMFRP